VLYAVPVCTTGGCIWRDFLSGIETSAYLD
jgi:hypothetical protein